MPPGVSDELEHERTLSVPAGEKRQWLVEPVAQPGVDVPLAPGILVGGQTRDGQHEMVREISLVGLDTGALLRRGA